MLHGEWTIIRSGFRPWNELCLLCGKPARVGDAVYSRYVKSTGASLGHYVVQHARCLDSIMSVRPECVDEAHRTYEQIKTDIINRGVFSGGKHA